MLLENSENSNSYKLIENGRVYDLDETKYYSFTTLNDVIGYDDYSEIALLDNDFKVARKVSSYVILKDYNNFAAETDDDKVEIYRNGEVIKTFEEDASSLSGVMYEDYYAISNNGKWKFYTLDGNEAFGGKEWDDIDTLFDRHHHAVVAEEEGKYYLIDVAVIASATARPLIVESTPIRAVTKSVIPMLSTAFSTKTVSHLKMLNGTTVLAIALTQSTTTSGLAKMTTLTLM